MGNRSCNNFNDIARSHRPIMRFIACLLMLLLSGPTLAIETPDFEVIGEIEDKVQIRQYDRFTLAKVARGDLKNGSDNQLFREMTRAFSNRSKANLEGRRWGIVLLRTALQSCSKEQWAGKAW